MCYVTQRHKSPTADATVVDTGSNPHEPCKPMLVSLFLTITLKEIWAFTVHYVEEMESGSKTHAYFNWPFGWLPKRSELTPV